MLSKVTHSSQLPGHAQSEGMLDANTVAAFLNVRRKRVYELVGHLAVRLGKRTLRWRRTDIDGWLAGHDGSVGNNRRPEDGQ